MYIPNRNFSNLFLLCSGETVIEGNQRNRVASEASEASEASATKRKAPKQPRVKAGAWGLSS
jgi:hypothetical protein